MTEDTKFRCSLKSASSLTFWHQGSVSMLLASQDFLGWLSVQTKPRSFAGPSSAVRVYLFYFHSVSSVPCCRNPKLIQEKGACRLIKSILVEGRGGFPGDSAVKNPPTNAGDIPDPEWSLMCRETKPVCHNYWACVQEPRSCNYWSPRALEPVLRNKTSRSSEKHCS